MHETFDPLGFDAATVPGDPSWSWGLTITAKNLIGHLPFAINMYYIQWLPTKWCQFREA